MRVLAASEPAPGRPENEDAALLAGSLIAVFDGVTRPLDTATGCVHDSAWFVERITARLRQAFERHPAASLAAILAEAIEHVRTDHGGQCDLSNPATPAATTCLLRVYGDHFDYLILSDCTLVVDQGGAVTALTDERFAHAIGRLREKAIATGKVRSGAVRPVPGKYALTNQPDGYWIAGADPRAAHEAVTGQFKIVGPGRVRRAALLTDGAACVVDQYRVLDWPQLLDVLTNAGPQALIRLVRQVETKDASASRYPRFKRYDDATAAICIFEE